MNNTFSESVRQLCSEYSGIITSSGVFNGNESAELNRSITEDVMPLLNFEKPKILVYGIYNGGKSTLVNAICGREVAEVANRPTTYKTDEYDAGKYILIDSPGIDAPVAHEEVADAEINSCHAILFVMSSKGGFEQLKNYTKMWELIQKNLPFIIIINVRAEDGDQEQQLIDLNNMKRKVIENLIKVSGQKNIENRYSVIVLDAKTAFKGITENKKNLIEYSRISDLTNEIDHLLEKESQLYLAPLSSLEMKIGEGEKILISKTASNDYAMKRETLQQMILRFSGTFPETVRYSAERHFDEIYQGYLNGSRIDMASIYNTICRDSEDAYKNASASIITYVRNNFSDLNITVSNDGQVTLNTPLGEMKTAANEHEDKNESAIEHSQSQPQSYSTNEMKTAGTAIGAAIGTFVPGVGTIVGGLIGGAIGSVADIFIGNSRRESAEYDRRMREVEAYNERQARKAEEENRRRQDARTAATNQINAIVRDLRTAYSDLIERNFNGVMNIIDEAISRISKNNAKIQNTLESLKQLRGKISNLRRQISC